MVMPGLCIAAALLAFFTLASAGAAETLLSIPHPVSGPKRLITLDDLERVRDIDTLSVSPDGRHYVLLVRQADAEANLYRNAWFVGAMTGGRLRRLADGGDIRLLQMPDGRTMGDIVGAPARWSPDGRWIAYPLKRDGKVQLVRTRLSDGRTERVGDSPGDLRDFAWSAAGDRLFFTSGLAYADLVARQQANDRAGTRLQDYGLIVSAIYSGSLPVPLSPDPPLFVVNADGSGQHPASAAETAEFRASQAKLFSGLGGGTEIRQEEFSGAALPPALRRDGAVAWLAKVDETQTGVMPDVRLRATLSGRKADAILCSAPQCTGQAFLKTWWSPDGSEIIVLRTAPDSDTDFSLFGWNPKTGRIRSILELRDGSLDQCDLYGTRLYCLRALRLMPRHLAAIDIRSGDVQVIADVNPEFANFDLGKVERIEWAVPPVPHNDGAYAARAAGFILYPPDYDPGKLYPVYIAPYSFYGFMRGDVGNEHPLLVYAANGFIVLNSTFPQPWGLFRRCQTAKCFVDASYGAANDYLHLNVRGASTFAGLDAAARRASIDLKRVGIGGVSNGAFIPLHMMLRQDRIAAASIGGSGWGQWEYYLSHMPEAFAAGPDPAQAFPPDAAFWDPIDLARHIDTIEAPLLINAADRELSSAIPLVRNMTDAHMAIEAYAFADEYHEKIQPAHRHALYRRNLDWFRFWLQDYEDPDPAKAGQYERWRKLRLLQCRNPRAVRRDFCG